MVSLTCGIGESPPHNARIALRQKSFMALAASGPENHPSAGSPDPQAVRIQLQRILSSPGFAGAPGLRRFLQFVVTNALEGRAEELKETVIGVELFQRPNFNPKSHAAVRTAATRVREKLEEYYQGPGKDDDLRIDIPKGRYIPRFAFIATPPAESSQLRKRVWQYKARPFLAVICIIGLIAVGFVFAWWIRGRPALITPPRVRLGRILAKATSEGATPKLIRLNYAPDWLVASPDEQRVYAVGGNSPLLTAISTKTDALKVRTLPQDGGPLAVNPVGAQLYVGSRIGGIMVIDAESDQHAPKLIPTAGPVWDLAVTPDGSKLFVAMSHQGVWRFLTKDWTARQVTNQGCPEHLMIGPDGRTLVVNYQCGGPGGRSGHDSVDFFDTQTEELLGTLNGAPFVGGEASFSPDGKSILLNGQDACSDSQYDHVNCPSVPSHVFHFVGMPDRRIVKSIPMPLMTESAGFIDPTRVLVFGSSLTVVNASLYTTMEQWQPKGAPGEIAHGFDAMALLPKHRRAYFNDRQRQEILILDAEDSACSSAANEPVTFYSGDGVLTDVAGESALSALGGTEFAPGRIGQAFALDGVSGHLVAQPSGHYRFGYRDSSLALYVKFDSLKGAMTILDRRSREGRPSARLAKTSDNRLAFDFARKQGAQPLLISRTKVLADRWYHVAVTKGDEGLAIYVNGTLEDRQTLGSEPIVELSPFYFGATWDGKAFLHGKLDEITFYNRALTRDQVHDLFEKRESGACRM
jgi:WD40 repeat protein